jgi:hypothetical protein
VQILINNIVNFKVLILYKHTMQQLTYWYLEVEAYKLDGNFFAKEICILKGDRTECINLYINQHAVPVPTTEEYQNQKSTLQLAWTYGEHTFEEAISIIKEKVSQEDLVFVSDPIAFRFLRQYLPKLTYQPCEIGFEMIHCPSENCDVRHGNQCARRRAHEIRYSDNNELL